MLILSCFSPGRCLRALEYSSPASLPAFIFQRASAFWASCGFFTPPPCSYPCRPHTFLPSLPLRGPYTTLGRRRAIQHLPGEDPTSLFGSTLMYDFHVPTSSARSVSSSGASFLSFRSSYLKGPQAFPQVLLQRAR